MVTIRYGSLIVQMIQDSGEREQKCNPITLSLIFVE